MHFNKNYPIIPRERRAFAHAIITQAKRDPSNPELINRAQEAVRAAGNSRKSIASDFQYALDALSVCRPEVFKTQDGKTIVNVVVLDETASDTAYADWVKQGQNVKLPVGRGTTYLEDMIKEGERKIDILVHNRYQVVPANLYRKAWAPKDDPEIDVRIVIDPKIRIPVGGLREGRRVIVYICSALEKIN